MTAYIKRSDIADRIDYYASHSVGGEHYAYEVCQKEIRDVPTADVAHVIHAKWDTKPKIFGWFCSNCDGEALYEVETYGGGMYRDVETVWSPYCPHCGSKMDLE